MGNVKVDRMNRTLLSMLKTLPETRKSKWDESLNKMVLAYNCTRHEATGYSPHFLLFGRTPRLPIDLLLDLKPDKNVESYTEHAQKWRNEMKEAYDIAKRIAQKATERNKVRYDKRVSGAVFHPSDRVLVRNHQEKGGPGKLRAYWEDKVYVVTERHGEDSAVYRVKVESARGPARVFHRNLLFPCDTINLSPDSPSLNRSTSRKKTKKQQQASQVDKIQDTD